MAQIFRGDTITDYDYLKISLLSIYGSRAKAGVSIDAGKNQRIRVRLLKQRLQHCIE